jgi:hypothetical protein
VREGAHVPARGNIALVTLSSTASTDRSSWASQASPRPRRRHRSHSSSAAVSVFVVAIVSPRDRPRRSTGLRQVANEEGLRRLEFVLTSPV